MSATTDRPATDQDAARLELLTAILTGGQGEPDGHLVLRTLRDRGDGSKASGPQPPFTSAAAASAEAARLAADWDVYVGAAPRYPSAGGISLSKEHFRRTWLVFVDCDSDDALDRLQAFPIRPTFTIESGGLTATGRANLHAWWLLDRPLDLSETEELLRALIGRLGSDSACKDASRVMRLPGTLNHKSDPPRPVRCVEVNGAVTVEVLREALSEGREGAKAGTNTAGGPRAAGGLDETLRARPRGYDSGRNAWLARVCGHLAVEYATSWSEYIAAVEGVNADLDVPLGDGPNDGPDEWRKVAQSIWKAEQAKRRSDRVETTGDEAQQLTDGWRLHSPVAKVEIWGKRADSPMTVRLEDGTKLRFEGTRDVLQARTLCPALMLQTNGRTSGPASTKQPDLLRLFGIATRLAEVREEADAVSEITDLFQRFLTAAGGEVQMRWTLSETAGRYAAIRYLQEARYDPRDRDTKPPVVRDHVNGDLLLRTTDLNRFVYYESGENFAPATLKARMREAGFGHREITAWPPGHSREKRREDPDARRRVWVFIQRGAGASEAVNP
jgi:hypothetical protein